TITDSTFLNSTTTVINQYQALTYSSRSYDLSGMQITANFPVALISGGESNFGYGSGGRNYGADMMLPTQCWGQSFPITTMMYAANKNYYHVVSATDNNLFQLFISGSLSYNSTLNSTEEYT